jgi:hypothetical protein
MLSLNGYRRNMSLTRRGLFFRPWTPVDPTIATVVTDPIHRGVVVNDRGVVNVVNVGYIHVVHRTVIVKLPVLPTSAFIALTKISVAVTDPAIEPYTRTPVAIVENVSVAAPTPIGGSPQQTAFRSHDPGTRYPVVVVVSISPVPRRPDITIAGNGRLLVNREFGRGERDRYADLRVGCRRDSQYDECEEQRTNGGNETHCASFWRDYPWPAR